jgi:serine/threonine protein kinase
MSTTTRCPGPEELRSHALGQLPDREAQLEQHLQHCLACVEKLDDLSAGDGLADVVRRSARLAEAPGGEAVDLLIERASLLTPTIAEGCSVLGAPRGPNELGWLGPYRVNGILGAGGMGIVFHAEDVQLRRPVALKTMLPSLASLPSARERFLGEARAAASLKHDHVVTIHQVGEDGETPFLVMELLQGETLGARLQRERRLPIAEALRIGRETAEGLAVAHAAGLIHRDIKPSNLWLEAKHGRVKILDFGLAWAGGGMPPKNGHEATTRLSWGDDYGTPGYMAPEQARRKAVDSRADLYSLGCVLYRACTGTFPYREPNTGPARGSRPLSVPLPPRDLNARVPLALSDLILRMLAEPPGQRPTSAGAVADALRAIEARHAWGARRRLVVGLALTCAVTLGVIRSSFFRDVRDGHAGKGRPGFRVGSSDTTDHLRSPPPGVESRSPKSCVVRRWQARTGWGWNWNRGWQVRGHWPPPGALLRPGNQDDRVLLSRAYKPRQRRGLHPRRQARALGGPVVGPVVGAADG